MKKFYVKHFQNSRNREKTTVAKCIVPDWGIQWTMAYRPAGLYVARWACTTKIDNPMTKSTLSSQSGTMNLPSDMNNEFIVKLNTVGAIDAYSF